jgi:hypothetical protein
MAFRLTGLDLAAPDRLAKWQQSVVDNLLYQPGVWFLINLAVAAAMCKLVLCVVTRIESKSVG